MRKRRALIHGRFVPLLGLPGYGWQPVDRGTLKPHVAKATDAPEARCINADGKGYETLDGCIDACNILNTEEAARVAAYMAHP